MHRSRLLALTLTLSYSAFAFSSQPGPHPGKLRPFHPLKGQVLDVNPHASRLAAARAELAAEAKGQLSEAALAEVSTGWSAKHKLYVGCSGTPVSATFATIQEALAAAQLYTVIKVCPGSYAAGGADTGITVNMSYIEIEGAVAREGSEVLSCDAVPLPEDESFGFVLLGSHDVVKNLTITDCAAAVASGLATEVEHNQVINNWFSGDYAGVYVNYGYETVVEDNTILESNYPIVDIAGIKDTLSGNTVAGDGLDDQDGIALAFTVGAAVKNNTVSGDAVGLDIGGLALTLGEVGSIGLGDFETPTSSGPYGYNTFAEVSSNLLKGNWAAIGLWNNNSGNKLTGNWVEDGQFGIIADSTSGAAAVPDSGTNEFISNHAKDNSNLDYIDDTYPYSGPDGNVRAGTADYWKGNKGNTASPPAILAN